MQVGGGGGVEYLTEFFFPLRNVPGVLKRGGGDFGVFGAPHAPTRGSRGVGKQYTSKKILTKP